MLTAAYVLSFVAMIVLPILLGFWLVRRFRLSWKLLLAGALTFIASQVLHIPLVLGLTAAFKNGMLPAIAAAWALLFNAVLLGLLAGIFEETARYILFKYLLKSSHTWEEGLVVGAGHGGIEALLIGVSAAFAFFTMLVYRSVDLSTIPTIPAEQLELAKQQVSAYWSAPVYMAFLGLVERVFAICLHLALSIMVLYSVAQRKPLWFWLALLWHAVVDGVAVFLVSKIGVVAVEAVIGLLAAISLVILFSLRSRFVPEEQSAPGA
jgi:uncharacterized membrane protein YhfC